MEPPTADPHGGVVWGLGVRNPRLPDYASSMGVLVERERCGAQAREQGADTGFDTRYLASVKRKIRTSFKVYNAALEGRAEDTDRKHGGA